MRVHKYVTAESVYWSSVSPMHKRFGAILPTSFPIHPLKISVLFRLLWPKTVSKYCSVLQIAPPLCISPPCNFSTKSCRGIFISLISTPPPPFSSKHLHSQVQGLHGGMAVQEQSSALSTRTQPLSCWVTR